MKELRPDWWRKLAPRERAVIGWGGGLLLLSLAYAYLWLPLAQERQKLRAGLPQMRATAAQMRVEAGEVARLRTGGAAAPSGAGLLDAVRQGARAAGIDDKSVQTGLLDQGRVNVAAAALPFDAWLVWTAGLQAGRGIRLESCAIEALPEAGMVRVQAVLAAAGQKGI